MENIREHIYLAALLHEIREFYLRGRESNEKIDPSENKWLQDIESKIDLTFGGNIILSDLYDLMTCMDNPKTELGCLFLMAESWSLGCQSNLVRESEAYLDFMQSIFNQINNGEFSNTFPLEVLDVETDSCFPYKIKLKPDGIRLQYRKLWEKFISELRCIPISSFDTFVNSMFYLLKKYVWTAPVNSKEMNDSSLFEKIKTTIAFIDSLFCYKEKYPHNFIWNKEDHILSIEDNCNPILFIGGDISGIQPFIYDVTSSKAAVSMKGRSFYLQLFVDVCVQKIISHKDIKATQYNIIYSSGGKFYMILPNNECVIKALDELRSEFEEYLWEEHFGKLIFNLAYLPFSYSITAGSYCFEQQKNQTMSDLWQRLANILTDCKNKKFKTFIQKNYRKLFEVQPIYEKKYNGIKVCAVTGIESDECVRIDDSEDSAFVLPQIKKHIILGNTLKDANYLLLAEEKDNLSFDFSIMGMGVYLLRDSQDNPTVKGLLRKLNSTDSLPINRNSKQDVVSGFQFYGGNRQAETSKRRLKTFEQLASSTYLGILRMDVDDLGSIFIKGFPERKRNFSSYATLSFLLDLFFCGYLNTIRNKESYRDDVNILYSGGDDIFAVGRWDKLLVFSKEIRDDFARFVGREDISISAGLVMVGEKYPIAKAAALAGEAEDTAKKFAKNRDGRVTKNAINLFGENVSWKDEFDFVVQVKDDFVRLIKNKEYKMPRSILHKLMQLCQIMRDKDMSYIWYTNYFLKRFSDGKPEEVRTFCLKKLQKFLTIPRNYELVAIAARWAELDTRKKDNK